MTSILSKYPPGSQWLYLRIYGGPQSLEEWLSGPFRKLLPGWRDSGLIKGFHYLHYLDPEYHLRLRFHLTDPLQSGIILNQLQESCAMMLEEDLLWKIESGTYEPEYDRYGSERMSLAEWWFEIDSLYWLEEICRIAVTDNLEFWKTVILSVDALLDDFSAGIDDKIHIINRLRESSGVLFGVNHSMKLQLDDKYRKIAGELRLLLETGIAVSEVNLAQRSADSREVVSLLQSTYTDHSEMVHSDLLPDLIHMSLNRAFRTRHRLQELVIYDFIGRYYESSRARIKQSGNSSTGSVQK